METEKVLDDPRFPFGSWMVMAVSLYELVEENRSIPFWTAQFEVPVGCLDEVV